MLTVIFVSSVLGTVLGVTLSYAELLPPRHRRLVVGRRSRVREPRPAFARDEQPHISRRFTFPGSRRRSLVAIAPALLDSSEPPIHRTILAGAVVAGLLLGFLFVTATRSSHAGWVPFLLTIVGVLLPSLRMMRLHPGFRPPLWLWLLGTVLCPAWSITMSPERLIWAPWVLLTASALVAIATAAILLRRADPLGNRS